MGLNVRTGPPEPRTGEQDQLALVDREDLTYESLEQVALEDVDDPLDGVSELLVLRTMEFGLVALQEDQSSLGI